MLIFKNKFVNTLHKKQPFLQAIFPPILTRDNYRELNFGGKCAVLTTHFPKEINCGILRLGFISKTP